MAINEIELLSEVLDSENDSEYQSDPNRFQIDNLDKLDWAVRKCSKLERDREQLNQTAQRQIIRLQAFIKDNNEKTQRNLDSLYLMMKPFVSAMLEGGKVKSVKTPSGRVGLRSQQPEIILNDEELVKFIEAEGRTELIETVKKPKWGDFKKDLTLVERGDGTAQYVTKDGEVVPVEVNLIEDKLVVEG